MKTFRSQNSHLNPEVLLFGEKRKVNGKELDMGVTSQNKL